MSTYMEAVGSDGGEIGSGELDLLCAGIDQLERVPLHQQGVLAGSVTRRRQLCGNGASMTGFMLGHD